MDHSDYHNTSQAFCLWLPQYIFLFSVVDIFVVATRYFLLSVVGCHMMFCFACGCSIFSFGKYNMPHGIFFYSLISNSGFTNASYAS